MFRADPENPFKGPHQNQPAESRGLDSEAEIAMVLIHGRGATARSILSLADELKEPGVYYIAPQAYRFSWYPYSFLYPEEQNQPGLNSALQTLHDCIANLEKKGFPLDKILLAGFSQGGCLVSEFAARHPERYGGIISLSGGLIGESLPEDDYKGSLQQTPFFLGCSDVDPHIPVDRVHKTAEILQKLNAEVTEKIYPGMAHTINQDELDHMKNFIRNVRSD